MSWADYMVECCMASRSLSEGCWDIVGEHSTLINACLNPCPTDKDITTKTDFKLSPKNEAGVFMGFATLKGTYGSVLMVGEGKYVVAREHVAYVQDHFPLQARKSANPELDWLHRLLGRNNDNDMMQQDDGRSNLDPQTVHSEEEEAAFDPSLLAPETATSAEFDSDGLESDDEVKAVMEQLDESVPLLSNYKRAVVDNNGDGYEVHQWEQGHGVDTFGSRDEIAEDRPTRRPKRNAGSSRGRDAINSAEFRARPDLQTLLNARKR